MSEPKVMFVTGEYPPLPGGVGDYTANLRMALAGIGVRTTVLAARGADGEDVHVVRRWGWSSLANVLRVVRREQVDVVHIQYQAGAFGMHPALNAMPSLLSGRIPIVTTFHDLRVPYLFPKAGRLRKTAIVRMARGSASVIVTNPADGRALRNAGVMTSQIPIGPNLPPPGYAVEQDRPTVAFFGFPSRSKGILDLLDALQQLPRPRPDLLLVGADGVPSPTNDIVPAAEIDERADEVGVHVDRTGFLPPAIASATLAGSTVLALPFRDGASLRSGSLLAGLQSGRPVVTTMPRHHGDLADLTDLPQLLLARTGDRNDLAATLARALVWSGESAPLPATFRWQSIATAHRDLYHRSLDECR